MWYAVELQRQILLFNIIIAGQAQGSDSDAISATQSAHIAVRGGRGLVTSRCSGDQLVYVHVINVGFHGAFCWHRTTGYTPVVQKLRKNWVKEC